MEHTATIPFIPPQASTAAGAIDLLSLGITIITGIFGVGVCFALVYLSVKYRRGNKVDRSRAPLYNLPIEIAWTGIPLILLIVMFVWATAVFLDVRRIPNGAMEIYVVGKQWMWKIQHPEGRWEMNELHVPLGRAVELTMTSEDVIHSFFVPAFRIHQDVIPGEYTRIWFRATKAGSYHLFCAQFCGTFHSQMTGTVTVMEPADYQRWLSTGTYQHSLVDDGAALFRANGCSGCHGAGSSVRAPTLEGLYGRPIPVQILPAGLNQMQRRAALPKIPATTVLADDKYIHDCIMLQNQIPAGFEPIMPTFYGRLSEADVFKLTAYIKSLATNRGTSEEDTTGKYLGPLSPEEYKARTGFIPRNIKSLTGGSDGDVSNGYVPTGAGRPPATNENVFGNASSNQGRTIR